VNFLTTEEAGIASKRPMAQVNLKRLAALKRQYDPDNLFSHTKGVA
jgi:FAD/FMN-containing dehydrogenase